MRGPTNYVDRFMLVAELVLMVGGGGAVRVNNYVMVPSGGGS